MRNSNGHKIFSVHWVSIGDYQEFKRTNEDKHIPAEIDWYISSVLANYKHYPVNEYMQSHMTYFLYVLLNKEFQTFLVRFRIAVGIPQAGFNNQREYENWRNKFEKLLSDYKNRKKIDPKIFDFISAMKNMPEMLDTYNEEILTLFLLRDVNANDMFYGLWFVFLNSVLFYPRPKHFLDKFFLDNLTQNVRGRRKTAVVHPLNNKTDELTIKLHSKSTINSIKATIDENKDKINAMINALKKEIKDNTLEVKDLERDYAIYKSYISHTSTKKRGEDISFNKRKEIHVLDEIESIADVENLDFGSLRKIVSRMNKRIDKAYSKKQLHFDTALDRFKEISPY